MIVTFVWGTANANVIRFNKSSCSLMGCKKGAKTFCCWVHPAAVIFTFLVRSDRLLRKGMTR